jgi:FeS assembly protein IscX
MDLKWTDSLELAIALDEVHPDVDPRTINFVDLRQWILGLDDFSDDPGHCGEKILEAVQLAWIEEKE